MLSFKQFLAESFSEIHQAIKDAYPHHQPLRIEHSREHTIVVSAFNRAVGKEKWFHVLHRDKHEWKHKSAHKNKNEAIANS